MSNESNLKEPTRESVIHKEKMKRQVVDNISAKGLVNGVMMSEILGAPRAKKPYRSILQDRIR
ncbi:hypothetical protein [Oceanobacillus massiliensis]|nr:hypothetical protein [Oceanobacillus massiliensis]